MASVARASGGRRLLVQSDNVAGRIAEPRGDLGGVGPDRLDDGSAVGLDGATRLGRIVDHDIEQETGRRPGASSADEGAADLAGRVIEGLRTVPACPHGPAEDLRVESRRLSDVDGRQLEITNLPVGDCGSHRNSERGLRMAARAPRALRVVSPLAPEPSGAMLEMFAEKSAADPATASGARRAA